MTGSKRILTVLLTVLLCAAVTVSAYGIADGLGHMCAGEHCAVCDRVMQCGELNRLFMTLCAFAAFILFIYTVHTAFTGVMRAGFISDTPVSRKIKLTD